MRMLFDLVKRRSGYFLTDSSGNFTTVFVIAAVPLIFGVGLSVDFSRLYSIKQSAQNGADMAALSVVKSGKLSETELKAQARDFFLSNFEKSKDLETLNVKAEWLSADTVGVSVNGKLKTTFMKVGNFPNMSFNVVAKVKATSGTGVVAKCLHALSPNDSDALIYNNKRGPLMFTGDSIIAPECSVQVNSSSTKALFIKEDEGYQFAEHCIVGGVSGSVSDISPAPDPSCKSPIPDPLAARPVPTQGGCISGGITSMGSTATVQPGNYCSGISVKADSVVFASGVFHISGGDVSVEANDQISGIGVSFVMHPGSGSISMETEGHLKLKAMSSGVTAGFLVFDRNKNNTSHLIKTDKNDISSMALDGFIYAPEDHVEIFWKRAGVGVNEKPLYFNGFGVIADTIDLHGYNQLYIEAADLSKVIPELAAAGGGTGNPLLIE